MSTLTLSLHVLYYLLEFIFRLFVLTFQHSSTLLRLETGFARALTPGLFLTLLFDVEVASTFSLPWLESTHEWTDPLG